MILPTQKWKTKSPSDSSHTVVTECQLNHFIDLPVFPFHSHAVIATFMALLPQNTADKPTRKRHRYSIHRDRQLTQNALFTGVHLSLVKISEEKTRSTQTQDIYVALIKKCVDRESSPYLQINSTHGMAEALKYDGPFNQGAVQKLKQSYCVKSSLLQK